MVRIQYYSYGGPETMRLEDFKLPTPGPGQVVVRVKYASINPFDWRVRQGQLKMLTGKSFPRAMGNDFSGTVSAVGAGVTRVKPGERVFGMTTPKGSGSLGEAVVTSESLVATMPDGLSFEQAACLPTAGVTAWNGLVDKAGLQFGQRVFVNGCAGSVGEAAVQLARMLGAQVAGSCSGPSLDRAIKLGVDPVYNYERTAPKGISERFDVAYDTSAAMSLADGFHLLRKGGVFLDINPSPLKFLRSFIDRKLKVLICSPRPEILDELAKAAVQGKLRVTIGETVPLTDAIRLIGALEKGQKINGKGLVIVSA